MIPPDAEFNLELSRRKLLTLEAETCDPEAVGDLPHC